MLFEHLHPRRIRTPAEAVELFEGLGVDRVVVSLKGVTPQQATDVVQATQQSTGKTFLSWGNAPMDEACQEALARLVRTEFEYLHVSTAQGNLRLWRTSWQVDGTSETVKMSSKLDAFAYFQRLPTEPIINAFINGPSPAALEPLSDLFAALRVPIGASLRLRLAHAAALTARHTEARAEWQAAGTHISFPNGKLLCFTPERAELARWRARVDDLLCTLGRT